MERELLIVDLAAVRHIPELMPWRDTHQTGVKTTRRRAAPSIRVKRIEEITAYARIDVGLADLHSQVRS